MTKPVIEIITKRNDLLKKTIKALEEKISSFPDGRIIVQHHQGGLHFLLTGSGSKKIYLGKSDIALIEQLIQKDYSEKILKAARSESAALMKAIKAYPDTVAEEVYDRLSEERRIFAKPVIQSDDQYVQRRMAAPYKCKPFKKGTPEFYTLKGEHVRSKSEVIIADMLERVNDYGRAGVFQGDRLFFTFESADHPLDVNLLDDFIENNYR